MSLSPRDLVLAQINHQETDHVPYTLRYEEDVANRLDTYYGSSVWRSLVNSAIWRLPAPKLDQLEATGTYYTDHYGCVWRVDRRPWHLVETALKAPSLEGYELPEVDAMLDEAWDREETLEAIEKQEDHFLVISVGRGVFERAWTLRGFEEGLMDSVANPVFYEELIEGLTNHQMEIVERLLELPVDGIMFADDWGYQQGLLMRPELWRRSLKPHLARLYARIHEAGKYVLTHCCGGIEAIMPDLIEIGLDVYQSVQPEPKDNSPYELKRKYGDKMSFWGGLGSQSIIPFGEPDEIRAEVSRLCREMGRGGGYILAPAKDLQPDTPTKNAAAIVESFLEQAGAPLP